MSWCHSFSPQVTPFIFLGDSSSQAFMAASIPVWRLREIFVSLFLVWMCVWKLFEYNPFALQKVNKMKRSWVLLFLREWMRWLLCKWVNKEIHWSFYACAVCIIEAVKVSVSSYPSCKRRKTFESGIFGCIFDMVILHFLETWVIRNDSREKWKDDTQRLGFILNRSTHNRLKENRQEILLKGLFPLCVLHECSSSSRE